MPPLQYTFQTISMQPTAGHSQPKDCPGGEIADEILFASNPIVITAR
jgi:hypothetical protein